MPNPLRYLRAQTAGRALRSNAALSLCLLLLLTTSGPAFAQTHTAVRLGAREAGKPPTAPASRKSGRESDARRAARTRSLSQAQDFTQSQVSQDGETVGMPWTGEAGVQRTTGKIMAAQARQAKYGLAKRLRVGKGIRRKEKIDRSKLPQDPDAQPLASTPGGFDPQPAEAKESPQPAPLAVQTVSTPNFTAATLADTGAFPPDTMGAVGPTQFFAFLNGRLRTFNKTTGVADGVVNADSDVFFASVLTPVPAGGLNFTSDPNVRFDRLSRRWFLTINDVPSTSPASIGDIPNRLLVAVSDAASNGVVSAGTVWTFYFVQQDTVGLGASNGDFLDYPSLGVDANALYVGGNMFSAATGAFRACTAFVIRKSSILSGGPIVTTAFRGILPNGSSDGPFAPRGADNYDPAATEGYLIGVSNAAFGRLVFRRVTDPGGTPTISANILLTVSSTSFPITVDHLGDTGGTAGNVDALDDRLFAAHIRNGRLWTSHNIAVAATGVASNSNAQRRNAVRWYELNGVRSTDNGGTPVVVQSGTIFDTAATVAAARQYFIPSVTVSGQGHAALGYSTAGTPFRIDAATNGRLRGDTLGTTGAVALYTASSTAYNPPSDPGPPRRFGDYSFTSLDPADDMTMWTIQQFCSGTNTYGVRVVRLLAPAPATPTAAAPAAVADEAPSTNVVITGTSVAGSEFFDPGTDIAGAEPFKHITATVTGGVTVNSVTYNSPTQVTLNVSTVGATPGPQTVTVTNPDGQSLSGTAVINVTQVAPAATAGQVIISEFRFRGAGGTGDEFVELYNNTGGALDISGFTLHALTAAGAQNLRYTVPGALGSSTTIIPARSHYLITGATYSLAAAAASNGSLSADIVDGSGVALFAGAIPAAATRIDSVGFDNRDALFFEGTPVTPSGAGGGGITVNGEYSFLRKLESGLPLDTGNNNTDFTFVSTTGGTFSTLPSTLGAPGPQNLASPLQRNATIKASLLDIGAAATDAPHRVRTVRAACPPASSPSVTCNDTNSALGTLEIRRKFTNNTGAAVTRLRFRIVNVTTLGNQAAGDAQVRALNNSGNFNVTISAAGGGGSVTVQNLTLEAPSNATNGGGYNSTLVAGTVTAGTPLAAGASINVNFMLGIQQAGTFRFFINVEALP